MDWAAFVEKLFLGAAGLVASYGAVVARRTKRQLAFPRRDRSAVVFPAQDACPEKLVEVDAEIARLWIAIGEIRERQRAVDAQLVVARHDRASQPGSRRG